MHVQSSTACMSIGVLVLGCHVASGGLELGHAGNGKANNYAASQTHADGARHPMHCH